VEPEQAADSTPPTADNAESSPAPAPGFESPEATFAAVQEAIRKGDWRAWAGCLTTEAQEQLVQMIVQGAAAGSPVAAPLRTVLEKHGIALDAPEKPQFKDLPGVIGDALAALAAAGGDQGGGPTAWARGQLANLSIKGERAFGSVTFPNEDASSNEPIGFRRSPSGWLIDASTFGGAADDVVLPETILKEGVDVDIDVTREKPYANEFARDRYPEGAVFVTLKLSGDAIAGTYEYGEFQLIAATDDTGRNLELAAPIRNGFGMSYGAEMVDLSVLAQEDQGTLPIRFVLTPPAPEAKQLSRLSVAVKLKAGSTIVLKNVLQNLGGKFDVSELADAGELVIDKWAGGSDGNPDFGVLIEFRGPPGTVQKATLLDKNDFDIGGNASISSDSSFGYYLGEAPPADLQVRLVLGDAKSIQVVPLEFENLMW
jgi:hypothetical protein